MLMTTLLSAFVATSCASTIPSFARAQSNNAMPSTQLNTTGFLDPVITKSQGGHADCIIGQIPVMASNQNYKLNITANMTNLELTQLVLSESYSTSSTVAQVLGSSTPQTQNISGTYNISAQLCFPASTPAKSPSTIQLLTHGFGFAKTYWDFGANTSYIDNAAQAGRITLAYDRLGIGNSSHPDPINVVQDGLQIQILHQLTNMLRRGALAGQFFDKVVGVGHSFGSATTYSVARDFPNDFDAVVLTGYSLNMTNDNQFTSSINLLSAARSFPKRFGHLPPGYIVPTSKYGIQYSFLKYPNFAPEILDASYDTIETMALGEQFSGLAFSGVATNYTGPVFIVDGENDISFCDGDCNYPENLAAAAIPVAFPNAANSSGSYILPSSGHGINLHLNANVAFDQIQQWVAGVGF